MTSVLIVDDQPMQRFGFRMLLESQDDLTVAGEAGDGAGRSASRRASTRTSS